MTLSTLGTITIRCEVIMEGVREMKVGLLHQKRLDTLGTHQDRKRQRIIGKLMYEREGKRKGYARHVIVARERQRERDQSRERGIRVCEIYSGERDRETKGRGNESMKERERKEGVCDV